jgi:hypothetical protein
MSKSNGVYRLGGLCSILLGVLSALIGITYLLLPPEQKLGMKASDVLPSFVLNPTLLTLQSIELALAGVLGLAVVPAVAKLIEQADEGWARWMSSLAYIGFGVAAVSNLLVAGRLPGIAAAFVTGDAATKAALVPVWRSTLDFQGWWQYGAIGLWILVTSLLAMRGNMLSKAASWIGIVTAILQVLVPIAFVFKLPAIITIVAIAGGIIGPIWYIMMGMSLRKHE